MALSMNYSVRQNKLPMRKNQIFIETFAWQDVRIQVKRIAPDLFDAIERLDPNNSYKLYKVRYPYGGSIIDHEGVFNIPVNDYLIPINSRDVPLCIVEQIGYNQLSLPLSLILHGQIHQFSETNLNSIYTKDIYSAGNILALPDVMDTDLSYYTRHFWKLTSGVRTPVMLPSIAEEISFMRLKRYYNLKHNKPESQQDHWRLFVELASKKQFPEKWRTELLIFSSKWLEHSNDDAWKQFRLCLLERSWKRSAYARNIAIINQLWDQFINSIRHKKTNNFVLNKVRYIIEASLNQAIVYVPFENNANAGPFKSLTDIFLDVYGLKKHAPIIMIPEFYDEYDQRPAYIPIQVPGLHYTKMKSDTSGSIISDTRNIKYFLNLFINQIIQENIIFSNTAFSKLSNINYHFYHADKDKYGELIPSALAFDDDPVMKKWRKHPRNYEVAYKNEFMRACVKMVHKKRKYNKFK